MKVWELNSPRDVERLILEQDLIIQELRENNKKLSDASMHWMVKFAEAKAETRNLEDLLGGAWTRIGELESQIRSLENEIVAVLDMYGK